MPTAPHIFIFSESGCQVTFTHPLRIRRWGNVHVLHEVWREHQVCDEFESSSRLVGLGFVSRGMSKGAVISVLE